MAEKTKSRQSNIELLRILAMLMVTMLHALGHGGILECCVFGTVEYTIFWFTDALCFVSVDVFVLITGYFMVTAVPKYSRIVNLMVQVEAYSLLCLAVGVWGFHEQITIKQLFGSVFPLISRMYWFVSIYAILILVMPLLNKWIATMSKRELLAALALLIVLYSVVPTFFYWNRTVLTNGMDGAWFIVLYLTGAYIRLYGQEPQCDHRAKGKWLLGYLLLSGGGY